MLRFVVSYCCSCGHDHGWYIWHDWFIWNEFVFKQHPHHYNGDDRFDDQRYHKRQYHASLHYVVHGHAYNNCNDAHDHDHDTHHDHDRADNNDFDNVN